MLRKTILLLTIFILVGCAGAKDVSLSINPLVLGGIADMTGAGSKYGKLMREIIDLRVSEFNQYGGIRGGLPLEIEWRNGNCNQRVSQEAASDLITNYEIPVIFGGVCLDETIGAAKETEKNAVILMSSASTNPQISDLGEYIFRTIPSDLNQGKLLAKHATNEKYNKVGVLIEKTPYTRALLNVFDDYYEGEIISLEIFPQSKKSGREQILEFQSQDVDAVWVLPQTEESAYLITSQLVDLNWSGGVMFSEVALKSIGIIGEFKGYLSERSVVGSAHEITNNIPKINAFAERYKERYGKELENINIVGSILDSVDIVIELLYYIDDHSDTKAIAELLYSTQHVGYTGNISFDSKGDLRGEFTLKKFDGEQFVNIE